MLIWIARIVIVIVLLCVASAIATPKGRIPIALRGIAKSLGRKLDDSAEKQVPAWKKLLAFVFITIAVLIALL